MGVRGISGQVRRGLALAAVALALLAGSLPGRAVPLGAVVATVLEEVDGQVGVYWCAPGPMQGLEPGDVVSVQRAGAPLGDATVMRVTATEVLISTRADLACEPGDRVVFLRRPPRAAAAAPGRRPSPKASPAPPGAAAQDPKADLARWLKEFDTRSTVWFRGLAKGAKPAFQSPTERALTLASQGRYREAADLFGQAAGGFRQESSRLLGGAGSGSPVEMRAREAFSLSLEARLLRAACLVQAGRDDAATGDLVRLTRENPTGVLASARAVSTVRQRARGCLQQIRERKEAGAPPAASPSPEAATPSTPSPPARATPPSPPPDPGPAPVIPAAPEPIPIPGQ